MYLYFFRRSSHFKRKRKMSSIYNSVFGFISLSLKHTPMVFQSLHIYKVQSYWVDREKNGHSGFESLLQ